MQDTADVLSQVAEAFRLRGSCVGACSHTGPWAHTIPRSDYAGLLVVTRGRIYFELEGARHAPLDLAPGDVVALPHGHAFSIRDDVRTPLEAAREFRGCILSEKPPARGGQTEFIALRCELVGGRANPVLRVLPPLVHCPGSDGGVARWLEPTVHLLAAEITSASPGRTTVLNRLAEVVFIQLIRAWLEAQPEGRGGWLRALEDPQLASALEAIHAAPGEPWTVASLARRANMSRSAFADRFRNLVGETPLDYLTRWRMQRAARLLESDELPLKEIVASSGYASEAAFRTMFRRWVGESPGSYRDRGRPA
jgi:AraC-like DNA-binding protein